MSPILVGSVYGASARSQAWYTLQQRFLGATTDYHHVAYVNGPETSFLTASRVIGQASHRANPRIEHLRGLTALLGHFTSVAGEYDGFLVLDSDAFPCSPSWQPELLSAMGDRPVAAVIRHENLDTFPHPCVVFLKPSALRQFSFSLAPRTNLLGQTFDDVACDAATFYPLLRTNCRNRHPIMGAIYWRHFYHHGAGSRPPNFRSSFYHGLPTSPADDELLEERLFNELVDDPHQYIRGLTRLA